MPNTERRLFLAGLSSLAACSVLPPALTLHARSKSQLASDLHNYDALGLAQLIKSKHVSAAELIDVALQRIEQLDSHINAMTTLTRDRAREKAQFADPNSLFAGVPTVFKDLIDVAGVRRTNGSRMSLTYVPKVSVDYVHAVEKAGLSVIGMTNTPEFASIALTDNEVFGPTRNPWDLSRSAGGSSGGSAAAVAAGYVPIAHGTDGGGSNRIPASCCGVFGMKASRYRQVSGEADGGHPYLRTHQCLSRSVRDSAAWFSVTESHNSSAAYSPVGLIQGPSAQRLRIALTYNNCLNEAPSPSVRDAIKKTAMLCESLGHSVEEIENPIRSDRIFNHLEGIMLRDMPKLLATVEKQTGQTAEAAGVLTPALVAIGRYAEQLPKNAYDLGIAYFELLTKEMSRFYDNYDVWLSPVIPIETPTVGYIGPETAMDIAMPRNRQLLSYTAVANGVGAPAMSVPLHHSTSSGLPIGSHFMAAPGKDRTLYELAFELEAALPWAQRWAPNSAAFL